MCLESHPDYKLYSGKGRSSIKQKDIRQDVYIAAYSIRTMRTTPELEPDLENVK